MNSHDLRLRNKSTHARGLVIFIAVRKRGKNTRKMHTTKFTCKYCSVGLLCSHSQPEALIVIIVIDTLVRGKLTLLEIKDRPYRHQNNYLWTHF